MAVSVLTTPTSTTDTTPAEPFVGLTHTVTAGAQRLLLLFIGIGDSGGRHTTGTPSYGGQNLTQIGAGANEGVFVGTEVWYLNEAGIAAAASNIFSIVNDSPQQIGAGAVALAGVDQTTPIDTGGVQTSTGATGTTVNVTVASVAGNLVVASLMTDDETLDSADDNQTTLYVTGAIEADTVHATQHAAGAASVLMQWVQTSNRFAIVGFEVNAAAAGGSSSVSPSVSPSASVSPSSSVSASASRSPSPSASLSPSSSVSSSVSPSGGATVYVERTVVDYVD